MFRGGVILRPLLSLLCGRSATVSHAIVAIPRGAMYRRHPQNARTTVQLYMHLPSSVRVVSAPTMAQLLTRLNVVNKREIRLKMGIDGSRSNPDDAHTESNLIVRLDSESIHSP